MYSAPSMSSLGNNDSTRIVAIAALTASDRDGEALAASRMLNKVLTKLNLRLCDVVERGLKPTPAMNPHPAFQPYPASPSRTHHQQALDCLMLGKEIWSPKEREFLCDIRQCSSLSPKQREWLDRLVAKLGRTPKERF
jgi:hypothetical protein